MTESASPSPSASSPAPEDAAAVQARRRKERREAKIKAGGSARLNKITGVGGGIQRDLPPTQTMQPTVHADPDEVDISEHFYKPSVTTQGPNSRSRGGVTADEAAGVSTQPFLDLQKMLQAQQAPEGMGTDPFGFGSMAGPAGVGAGDADDAGDAEDPIMAMLNQMRQMGGGGGGGFPGAPEFGPGSTASPPASTVPTPVAALALWRLVHFAVAVALGLYVALATPFAGTRDERDAAAAAAAAGARGPADDAAFTLHRKTFFYAFTTAETVLLTTRYVVDKWRGDNVLGGAASSSIVGMALGFLPPGVRRSVKLAQRYWQIFSTVRSDLLVCIFVLGVCSWLRT